MTDCCVGGAASNMYNEKKRNLLFFVFAFAIAAAGILKLNMEPTFRESHTQSLICLPLHFVGTISLLLMHLI
jgi:hypothetical protein